MDNENKLTQENIRLILQEIKELTEKQSSGMSPYFILDKIKALCNAHLKK